jgi:hypothetical protein
MRPQRWWSPGSALHRTLGPATRSAAPADGLGVRRQLRDRRQRPIRPSELRRRRRGEEGPPRRIARALRVPPPRPHDATRVLACGGSLIVGARPIPTRAMPEVVARIGIDLDPIDVTDAEDAQWLRACVWPDEPERVARLEAEMALVAKAPPLLLHGDAVALLPDASPMCRRTPCLSSRPRGHSRTSRSRAACASCTASTEPPTAGRWVSAEGVGVAPTIPTLGDRRASGHSIVGLAVFEKSALSAEAIGRCWSRCHFLAWFGDS